MHPTVHLNGTSKAELQRQLLDAIIALGDAEIAVQKAAPNGRDYYPQGRNAINDALTEHASRLSRLASVRSELEQIAEGL